ncbi:MAG: hypothetical protein Q8Q33_01730 [Chlamydiota bacterium]|nr:hypothetical protein [Chlamydiota bacterium]
MKKTWLFSILIPILVLCSNTQQVQAEDNVEFTVSNYTGDYAIRVTKIILETGTVTSDDLTGQRLDDGDTKAIYVTGYGDMSGIQFGIMYEIIDHPEMCGENNEKCAFGVFYEDSWTNIVNHPGDGETIFKIQSPNSLLPIKNAGHFTKDDHPWCKIHIEK